jgi:hypothetical protein
MSYSSQLDSQVFSGLTPPIVHGDLKAVRFILCIHSGITIASRTTCLSMSREPHVFVILD